MSYTYLLESGEESSAGCYSDIPAFVLSKLSLSAEKFSCNGNATESCPASPSGTMCEHLTANRGAEKLTASAEPFPAKTSQRQAKERASTEREADYGASSPVLLAKYDRDTRSWKTPQCSLIEDSGECLETFPKSGTMRGGVLWELTMWAHPTVASESGFWRIPTPLASDGSKQQGSTSSKIKVWSEGAFRALLDSEKLQYAVHSDDERMADGIPDFVDRFRAIGNGQVPLVAATAFNFLKREF